MSEQKELSVIFNEVEKRYQRTLDEQDDDAYEESLSDVPRLVKALRRQNEFLQWALKRDPGLLAIRQADITAILNGEEKQKDLEKQRAV